ncbi:hypothetical protein AYL99_11629 [Fonsecaea erecta]|uniref:Uncharacterized protein n=1 Tax=Fonsecaea erecta TaxID=1367422 RepID=A0A178Z315_9EURO|nr:hypothetical protein AYL99_11629 [Fonsecaea erecta]OAP54094.1 hypothetical protein AYL99_11629 [Fonsecaea erecta]
MAKKLGLRSRRRKVQPNLQAAAKNGNTSRHVETTKTSIRDRSNGSGSRWQDTHNIFGSKSRTQLQAFDTSWQTVVKQLPNGLELLADGVVPDWPQRIRTIAKYLENRALDEWRPDRRENEPFPLTWDLFIVWGEDTIEDADVRKGEALQKFGDLKQAPSQVVRDLLHEIILREDEVVLLTEGERRGWALFHALLPPVRDVVQHGLSAGEGHRRRNEEEGEEAQKAKPSLRSAVAALGLDQAKITDSRSGYLNQALVMEFEINTGVGTPSATRIVKRGS